MQQVHCDGCGEDVPSYDITHYGSIEGAIETFAAAALVQKWRSSVDWIILTMHDLNPSG
jgi:hypothetical protein